MALRELSASLSRTVSVPHNPCSECQGEGRSHQIECKHCEPLNWTMEENAKQRHVCEFLLVIRLVVIMDMVLSLAGIVFSKRACLKMGGISPQRASLMGEKVDNPLGFWSSPLNSQATQIPMVNGSALSWTLWTIPGASGACGSCGCPESRGLKGPRRVKPGR